MKKPVLRTERLLALIPAAALIYTFFLLALNLHRGFDITDESFYLLWAKHPAEVLGAYYQFGHYTGLLYALVGQNLPLFRLAGLLLLLAVGVLFAGRIEAFQSAANGGLSSRWGRFGRTCTILLGIIAYYSPWITTPSYNWLALIAVLCAVSALLGGTLAVIRSREPGADSKVPSIALAGWAAGLGLAGALSFMAKPTTALILVLVVLFWVSVSALRGHWKLFVGIALLVSVCFVAAHIFLFEKGIQGFFQDMRDGMRLGQLIGGYTVTKRLLEGARDMAWAFVWSMKNVILPAAAVPFLLLFLRRRDVTTLYLSVCSCALMAWLFIWRNGCWGGGQIDGWLSGLGGMAFSLSLLLVWLAANQWKLSGDHLFALLFLAGVGYAFGSDNGLVHQMSLGFVFLVSASMVAAARLDRIVQGEWIRHLVSVLLSIAVVLLIRGAYRQPYRIQGPISAQSQAVTLAGTSGTLYVDEAMKRSIVDLRRAAADQGWSENNCLIDLTGETPGAAVILGARTPGTPWLFGAKYPGFAKAALELADPTDLQNAWVLTASPFSVRHVPSRILQQLGLKFPSAYQKVGVIQVIRWNGRQTFWNLWKRVG